MAQNRGAEQRVMALREAAETLCSTLPPLMVQTTQTANSTSQGEHGRRRVGTGEAFWQFRRFAAGDATANIDWRQSAKSQHLYVRENEREAAETIWCWCAQSRSMDYRSEFTRTSKQDRSLLLMLAVAGLLLRSGERIGLIGADTTPQSGRAAFSRFAETLIQPPGDRGDDVHLPPVVPVPRHSKLLLIGDFLMPVEEMAALVHQYSGRGAQGYVLQVLDPAEEDLPFNGRVRFEGVADDGELTVGRAQSLRTAYRQRVVQQREELAAICRGAGWHFAHHRTDEAPQSALLTLYNSLSGSVETAAAGC